MKNKYKLVHYAVGEKFDRSMAIEGGIFEIHDSMCECSLGLSNITDEEIKSVDKGPIYVGLSYIEDVIFISININNVMSFNLPFNMALYDTFRLKNPGKKGYVMPIFLFDIETNIIKAIRVVGFNNEFSKKLYKLSQKQWENGVSEYNKKVIELCETYLPRQIFEQSISYNLFGGITDGKA